MSKIEWLTGYLEGIANLNSVYGYDANCWFELKPVERKETTTETIIAANEQWEGKYLSSYEYQLEQRDINHLRERINHWFLRHIISILFSADVENPYEVERVVKRVNCSKIDHASVPFLKGLENYLGKKFDIFEFKLATYSKKPDTPRDYSFDFYGEQFLLFSSTKALILTFDESD